MDALIHEVIFYNKKLNSTYLHWQSDVSKIDKLIKMVLKKLHESHIIDQFMFLNIPGELGQKTFKLVLEKTEKDNHHCQCFRLITSWVWQAAEVGGRGIVQEEENL